MNDFQNPQPNKSVFFSYSIGGEEGKFLHNIVEQLHQDLAANHCHVWMFERESIGGIQFQEQYKHAIKHSDAFVLFCNLSARKSIYIDEEINTALEHGKPIIQILLDYEGPHPLLKNKNLTPIRYNDPSQRNRIYLLHHMLRAIGLPMTKQPGDKFQALDQLWKVYRRDPMYYPIYNPDSICLLGSESSPMDIQTETDFNYASLKLTAESSWKTETSVGFEKWYEENRFSIALQNGSIWIRGNGHFWSRSQNYPIRNWKIVKVEKSFELEIQWMEFETNVLVNHEQVCQVKTRVHVPIKVRLNADCNDYIAIKRLEIA